jgi:hypothetical protein
VGRTGPDAGTSLGRLNQNRDSGYAVEWGRPQNVFSAAQTAQRVRPEGAGELNSGFQPWKAQNKRLALKGARGASIETITIIPSFRMLSTFDLPPLQGASLGGRFPGLKPVETLG